MLAIAIAVVSTVFRPAVAFELFGFSHPEVNAELSILIGLGLCLDASMFLVAKNHRISHEGALNFGLLYQVLRSFSVGLNMVRIDGLAGLPPSALTFAFGGLLLFPLLIPLPRNKAFLVSLLAAATQPTVLAAFSPLPVPTPVLVHSVVAAAATVAFAVLCGRLGYSLTAHAARGRELGPYHLEKLLRRDHGGELWRATHRRLARPAALKTVRPWLVDRVASGKAVKRFRREARLASTLTSPHTVTLYDFGVSEDGCLFCALELIDGESLARRVRKRGPLSPAQAKALALEVCDSLEEAHSMGLLHRALTPDSVYFCRVGRRPDFVKVSGLGRARLDDVDGADSALSSSSPLPVVFVAPEVRAGLPATKRSDIYQLGGVLFFALTGHLAPGAGPLAAQERGLVPQELSEVLERCLAEEPSDRFASVEELRSELCRFPLPELRPESTRPPASTPMPLGAFLEASLPSLERLSSLERLPEARPHLLEVASKLSRSDEGSAETVGEWSVSPEALDASRQRLAQVGVLSAALTTMALPIALAANHYLGQYLVGVVTSAVLGVASDLVLCAIARSGRWPTTSVFRAALVYFTLRCTLFAFTVVHIYLMLGLPPPRVTFASIFVMLLPAFVPGTPRKLFVPSLVAVLASSTVLVWANPAGMPVIALYSALALMSSMFTARIMSGLRAAASRPRSYGGYRLLQRIGRGAMGDVWSAEHELLARPAAVKLIRPVMTKGEVPAFRRRFEHEAYVTALLTSPHTVTLYDYGIADDGSYYYVMELLEGEDLERHVNRFGPLSPERVMSIALQSCDSLAEAHGRGLVHRDLKPANLFLARAGCRSDFVKVLDFGLAELVEDTTVASDRIAGTPHYMAPEVFRGDAVDARSDLYQLGCCMFFLLTGSVPFQGANFTTLALAHVQDEPPTLASSSPYVVPEALERIVARCLEKDPDDRYASAEELEAALALALADSGAPSSELPLPSSPADQSGSWVKGASGSWSQSTPGSGLLFVPRSRMHSL